MACQFCKINGTGSFMQFVQQSGHCNLIIEAQWVVVVLVTMGFLLLLVLIESGIMIGYGCYYCYRHKQLQTNYRLQVLTKKGEYL